MIWRVDGALLIFLVHMHSDGTALEYGMGGAVQQFDENGNHCTPGVFREGFTSNSSAALLRGLLFKSLKSS